MRLIRSGLGQREVEQGRHFFLEFQQDAQFLVLGFERGQATGIALAGGFFVFALLRLSRVRFPQFARRAQFAEVGECGGVQPFAAK